MAFAVQTRNDSTIAALQANRVVASLAVSAKLTGGRSTLDHLSEGGGYRIKFPDPARGLEAVIVNTGGGLLGGDRLSIAATAGAGADLMVTTQSAEKIYRAVSAASTIDVRLTVEAGATLHWLPQEAILFGGARLTRRIDAEMAEDAELVIAEAATFGRLAMGEVLGAGLLADRWRIRRGGRLAFAEDVRLDGDLSALLDRPALGGGARAAGTIVVLAPDAESRLDRARELIGTAAGAGASAWNGRLVVRMLGADPAALRATMEQTIAGLTGREKPRFW